MFNVGRILPGLALACLGSLTGLVRADPAEDIRFSATLTAEQRTVAGLAALTPDNVAVIDGLVRQDEAASRYKQNPVDGTRFSERRTAREREMAGLDALNADQRARLDEFVRRRIFGPGAETATPATAFAATAVNRAVKPVRYQRPLEIHGEASYTVGWSKAGSFQGGSLVLTYDDPAHRYSVLVGYSEYHGKGLPRCFYPGGGPYRPYAGEFPLAP